MIRIYQAFPFSPESMLQLDDKASHHLKVLRSEVGDEVILFNGQGGEYQSVITRMDKKSVEVRVKAFAAKEVESPLHIHLAQGMARGEKMDLIVQKAVELGVSSITPLVTERCNVRLSSSREERRVQHWQEVAISACEQSGRNRVPIIELPLDLSDWLASLSTDSLRFVLSPHVAKKLPAQTQGKSIVLLIGPEGGLSDKEVGRALDHGFMALNLGPRVLRTETASLAALAALQTRYGDMSD